ncbi:BamA/TamA family outer membrane protein [Negadavirga shengliensis]|uniref:BamA/TamA family outer membrane protein n=1 Tax=Negadavirga shengliensis TaxID=1389218 RepID=A0ABV9T187_9BACT
MKRILFFSLTLFGMTLQVWAQMESESRNKGFIEGLFDTADEVIGFISRDKWTFIPAITYAPETSLGLGARAIKVFRHQNAEDSLTRPSTLPITFLYTLNRQAFLTGELNLWKSENNAYLNARVELADFPFKFSGIGENVGEMQDELYATRYFYFHINYEKRIAPGIYIGPRYEFRADDIYEKETGKMLDSGHIPGSDGQRLSGIGMVLNYDTRDNIFQPANGAFHQASYMGFHSALGSNFSFSQYVLDFRKYLTVRPSHVWVGQAWFSFTSGDAPFQHISLIGGSDVMRGYFEGRFRDRHAMAYQTEYRLPVHRNLGLVLFGSAGQISPDLSGFRWGKFRYGGGVGFRYKLNDDGLNIRLDIAVGDQKAFYFGLNEVI